MKLVFLSFCLLVAWPLHSKQQDVLQHIETDFTQGRLSHIQAIAYQLAAIRHSPALPDVYRTDTLLFTRRATELKTEAYLVLQTALAAEGQMLRSMLNRPVLPLSIASPAGHFRIHYTDTGADAAGQDFIRETALAFDYAYTIQIEQLGFNPPPLDFGVDGPEYDVYVHQYGDYGATTPEQPVPGTPQEDYTGWIEIDNDFTHTPTKGLDGMRVTAAHEFFHLVQFGYRSYQTTENSSVYFYEATACWMEDIVFDHVNDYYNYLSYFFRSSEQSFIIANGNHEYGLSIFFHMLAQKYGVSIMRSIWNEMMTQEPLTALNKALLASAGNFNTELGQFAIWNCHTGTRADTVNYYHEGKHFPEVTANQSLNFNTQLSINGNAASLSCKYIRITTQTSGSQLLISPTFSDPYNTLYACVVHDSKNQARTSELTAGHVDKMIAAVPGMSEIWIIPIYLRNPYPSTKEMTFQFSLTLGEPGEIGSEITLAYPNPFVWTENSEIVFEFQLRRFATEAQALIYTEQGALVSRQPLGPCMQGWNKCSWNGRDDQARSVNAGIYLFVLRTPDWWGSYKFALIR